MMERLEAYYLDVLRAIELIQAFLKQGHVDGLGGYRKHEMVKSAVDRQLGIIGEAVNNIRKVEADHAIPDADRIVAFRNRLIHSYESIDDQFVWPVIEKDLPLLKTVVEDRIHAGF